MPIQSRKKESKPVLVKWLVFQFLHVKKMAKKCNWQVPEADTVMQGAIEKCIKEPGGYTTK